MPRDYTKSTRNWHYQSINEVIAAKGQPSAQVTLASGNKIYVYKTNGYNSQSTPPASNIAFHATGRPAIITSPTPYSNIQTPSFGCTIIILSNPQGKIINIKTQGNGCVLNNNFAQ